RLHNGAVKVLVVDLESQGVFRTFETSSMTLCSALGEDALVFDNEGGLLAVEFSAEQTVTHLLKGEITCLSSVCVGKNRYIVLCGENNGMVHAWVYDLGRRPS